MHHHHYLKYCLGTLVLALKKKLPAAGWLLFAKSSCFHVDSNFLVDKGSVYNWLFNLKAYSSGQICFLLVVAIRYYGCSFMAFFSLDQLGKEHIMVHCK